MTSVVEGSFHTPAYLYGLSVFDGREKGKRSFGIIYRIKWHFWIRTFPSFSPMSSSLEFCIFLLDACRI